MKRNHGFSHIRWSTIFLLLMGLAGSSQAASLFESADDNSPSCGITGPATTRSNPPQLSEAWTRLWSLPATACPNPQFRSMRIYGLDSNNKGRPLVADFNNDGKLDLILNPGNINIAYLLLGQGTDGGLSAPQQINANLRGDLVIADINHDANVDLVSTQMTEVKVWLGNGDGTFQLAATLPVFQGAAFTSTDTGDFNRDGSTDLAIVDSNFSPSRLFIYFGNNQGTYAPVTVATFSSSSPIEVHAFDLNHDNRLDIVVSDGNFTKVWVMLGNGLGGLGGQTLVPMYGNHLRARDVNNDGYLDLVAINYPGFIALGDGNGNFAEPYSLNLGNIGGGTLSDISGDGNLDLAYAIGDPDGSPIIPGQIRVRLGDGLGNFQPPEIFETLPRPGQVEAADLNGDGKPDLVSHANGVLSGVTVQINSCNDTSPRIIISGTVQDDIGNPVYGSIITVDSTQTGPIAMETRGGSGFDFSDLPPNVTYTVSISNPQYDFHEPTQILIAPTTNQFVTFTGTARRYRIYGYVGDFAQSLGLANVPLHLVGPNNVDRSLLSAADGSYSFNDLPQTDGVYSIQVGQTPIATFPTSNFSIISLFQDQELPIGGNRSLYSVTVQALTANGSPSPAVQIHLAGTNRNVLTGATGLALFTGLGAGFDYTFVTQDPVVYTVPASTSVANLLANQSKTIRASLRPPSDFDGDGRTDISVFRPANGGWYVSQSLTGAFRVEFFGLATDLPAPADYDGDLKTDIAVFRPSDGYWYMLMSANGAFRAMNFGTAGDVPIPADLDRDGKAELAVYRPSTGYWYIQSSIDQSFRAINWGISEDQPFIGQFDGDTINDIFVFRPSNGTWYIRTNSGAFHSIQFGTSGDRSMLGDFDGDNRSDLCVWRPSSGSWYVLRSSGGALFSANFGLAGDIPMAGDFDGDGRSDLTVFRPGTGAWYILQSASGNVSGTQWGLNGDMPIPGAFTR